MKARNLAVLAGLALSGPAWAADFGVMETAESIEPRAFKLEGFPMLSDRPSGNEEGGFAVGLGYGLPFGLDIEGQVARDDVATYYGSDVEWNAWTFNRMKVSLGSGVHTIDIDRGGTASGADATAIFTWTPVRRLDLNAALDASYEDVNAGSTFEPDLPGRWRSDNQYETYYFAPGIEYSLLRDLDLVAEVGIGLNGASDDYAGAGLSWYLR